VVNRGDLRAWALVATFAMCTWLSCGGRAWAQPQAAPTTSGGSATGRFEVSGGVGWFGSLDLGERDAVLRPNGPRSQTFALFNARPRLGDGPTFDGRVSVMLTPGVAVEGRFLHARSELAASLSCDVEGAASLTATEPLSEYLVEGGATLRLTSLEFARMLPFVAAGGGYRRQLHDGRALVEEGKAFYVGGGVRQPFFTRALGGVRSVGWRVDARLYLLSGVLAEDDDLHPRPSVGASLFVAF
jgi:hypothetical protein